MLETIDTSDHLLSYSTLSTYHLPWNYTVLGYLPYSSSVISFFMLVLICYNEHDTSNVFTQTTTALNPLN
jgi:hypothetical protein